MKLGGDDELGWATAFSDSGDNIMEMFATVGSLGCFATPKR